MAKGGKAYFGLGWLISVILAIIPITAWIFGVITRISRGHLVAGVFNIFLGPLFWIVDLITMIFCRDLVLFA